VNQETVLVKVSAYAPAEQVEQLRQTLSQAERAFHHSQLPYDVTITRPTSVALILAEWQVPVPLIETVVWSAALHKVDRDQLLANLDADRFRLAINLINFMGFLTECRHRRQKCEVNLAVLKDFWREGFFVLVMAMFLDALRHCAHSHTIRDKKEMAAQAHTIFEPIVSTHLGLLSVEHELRDLSFECEDAQKYAEAKGRIHHQRQIQEPAIDSIESDVKGKAHEYGFVDLKLERDFAHPYLIKSSKQQGRLRLRDLVSFVVLLPDEDTCFRFLRVLRMLGNAHEVPSRPGEDHSLHSRIDIAPYGPINFSIRTPDQDKEVRFGVLNQWQNGEKKVFENAADLIPHSRSGIFVYTMHGEPHLLPHRATPVDLAYKVNEMIGHRYSIAYIFGKEFVKSDYPLEDGDIVEIRTGHHAEPDRAWLKSVQTKEARKYIRQWEAHHAKQSRAQGNTSKVPPSREITDAVALPPEYEGAACRICTVCKPHPPQPIWANVTLHGLTIHQISCTSIHNRTQTISVSWRPSNLRSVSRVLTLEAWDHVGLLREVAEKIAACNINVVEIQAESRTDTTAHFAISLQEKNPEVVEKLSHALYEISAVNSITVDQPKEIAISAPYVTRGDSRKINPYTNQPVVSPSIFFGRRDEILHIWRTLQSGGRQNSILFWGQQRIGKTSLLRHFEARALEDSSPYYVPVHLSILKWQYHHRTNDLVLWFASQMDEALTQISSRREFHFRLPKLNQSHFQKNPVEALAEYFGQIQQAVSPSQLIVMIDEFQQLSLAPNRQSEVLIEALEHLLATFRDISFIFAGWGSRSHILYRLHRFADLVPLGVLESAAAEHLIRLPVRPFLYEADVVEKILDVTHCHPYYIHLICGSMIDDAMDRPVTQRVLTEKDFDKALEKLVAGNAGPFSHLLEATHNSDIVLDALARASRTEDRYVELPALLRQLNEELSLDQVSFVLDVLTELAVLERSNDDKDAHRILVPLFQQWLKRNPLHS